MIFKKELVIRINALERDYHDINKRYWDLYTKHEQLLKHLGLVRKEISQHTVLEKIEK